MSAPAEKPKAAPTFQELQPTPAPEGTPAPPAAATPKVVMQGARPVPVMSGEGPRPPGMSEPPAPRPEEVALIAQIDREINFEMNVLHMCYGATRNLVSRLKAGEPPDIAEFQQFGGEKRTPIETAEPQMALEVYRQVRENLRRAEEARAVVAKPTDTISVIAPGINAALVALSREKP